MSRRSFFAATAALPVLAEPASSLKVIVAGGHPGDPECGCAGTIARYTDLGHQVVVLYLNRGEGYCGGASLDRCAGIRTAEANQACEILKARPAFAGQYDGRAIVDAAHDGEFARLLAAEKPDVVFTQWPVDSHRDHRALSMLTLDAWLESGKKFALYYYEVAEDTTMFSPTDYVDISPVESRRRAACYAHASQRPISGIRNKWKLHAPAARRAAFRKLKPSSAIGRVSAPCFRDSSSAGRADTGPRHNMCRYADCLLSCGTAVRRSKPGWIGPSGSAWPLWGYPRGS